MIKKVFIYAVICILLSITTALFYIANSLPSLPSDTEAIITSVIDQPLPELVSGKQGYARSGDINIWYEVIEPERPTTGTVLLMMGISNDALGWPPQFLTALRDSGYRIIRYDYRGTGMSDWMENWDRKNPYTLNDMASDARAVIDSLNIEKAHVLGISLGGMVAQQMAINHPERVHSLVSMMSSCDILDPQLPPISMDVVKQFIFTQIRYGLFNSEKNIIKLHLTSRAILRGEAIYALDTKSLAESVLYNMRKRKGYNPKVSEQHNLAVMTSGSRFSALANLEIPTLIIHGEQDPFIAVDHGIKCATTIPDATLVKMDGMGHDLPSQFTKSIVHTLAEFWSDQKL